MNAYASVPSYCNSSFIVEFAWVCPVMTPTTNHLLQHTLHHTLPPTMCWRVTRCNARCNTHCDDAHCRTTCADVFWGVFFWGVHVCRLINRCRVKPGLRQVFVICVDLYVCMYTFSCVLCLCVCVWVKLNYIVPLSLHPLEFCKRLDSIYTLLYTKNHICIHIESNDPTWVCENMYWNRYICKFEHIYIYVYIRIQVHMYIHIICIYMRIHTYTCRWVYVYTYIIYVYAYIHIYICICIYLSLSLFVSRTLSLALSFTHSLSVSLSFSLYV